MNILGRPISFSRRITPNKLSAVKLSITDGIGNNFTGKINITSGRFFDEFHFRWFAITIEFYNLFLLGSRYIFDHLKWISYNCWFLKAKKSFQSDSNGDLEIGNDLFRDFISTARPERKSAFLIPEFDSFDIKLDSEDFQGTWST